MAANTLPRPMKISEAVYRIQFSLIECSSCSSEQLLTAGSLLSCPDYQDVVVERSIVGFCGYPLCHNRLPVDRDRHARFRVSLRDQRIYDLEETYKYCSEACQARSMAFSKSLSAERVCDLNPLNQARIEKALRLFGNWDVGGEEFGDEGDLGIKSLSIKDKRIAGAGEVSLNEWIGPTNAIEGYVPQSDRIADSGLNFIPQQHSRKKIEGARDSRAPSANSSLLVGNEANEIRLNESSDVKLPTAKKRDANTTNKKTKPKKTTSKTSKLKSKKNLDDYGHGNMHFTSCVIVGTEFDDHNALSLTGQDISEVIAKQLENVVLEEKNIGKKAGISKPSRFKDHKKLEDATNEKVLSKEINGELVDVCFSNESDKTAVNISNYEEFLEKKVSSNETTVKELEDKISSAKKEISEKKLLKSCLKNSGSKVGDHYVKWVDEKRNASFEDKMTIPQESSEELFDSSVRFASAEVCAAALTQAAESVVSGKAEVGDAVSEAGILILPQSQCLEGEREDDEDIFKFDEGIVKWPKKTVLLDTNMFEVEDSWHDTPPEGFSINLSPFATMWMALFGWITCSSLAYIYGHDESSYENFMLINGKEYPRKVIMSDGQSLEIRQTLDGFICRTLPVVVKDLRLPVPISTLEKFMDCLLNTMSFMDAIPSFKIRQWQVIILLFIEALSVHRLLVLAPHLMSRGTQLKQAEYSHYQCIDELNQEAPTRPAQPPENQKQQKKPNLRANSSKEAQLEIQHQQRSPTREPTSAKKPNSRANNAQIISFCYDPPLCLHQFSSSRISSSPDELQSEAKQPIHLQPNQQKKGRQKAKGHGQNNTQTTTWETGTNGHGNMANQPREQGQPDGQTRGKESDHNINEQKRKLNSPSTYSRTNKKKGRQKAKGHIQNSTQTSTWETGTDGHGNKDSQAAKQGGRNRTHHINELKMQQLKSKTIKPKQPGSNREATLAQEPRHQTEKASSRLPPPCLHQKMKLFLMYDPHTNPTHESLSYPPSTHQSDSATPSPHHTAVTYCAASFVETNRGHPYDRDHPSLDNIRVAAPPWRSSPSLDGRPFSGSSFGSVSYDSPLGPTPSHLSQPLASPDLDPASVILVEKCIRKKRSPENECIHFVDANDITDNEDFFEDETEVIKLDSLYDLNPDLGVLEPLDLATLVHPDPNVIKDIPLDKLCPDDINLISKEADMTLNTLKFSSDDSDFIISPNETIPNNSDLILNNSDVDNLELEVSQLDLLPKLDPDLIDPKPIELRVIIKHEPNENTNMSLEDSNLNLKDYEPNWNNEHSLVLLESILGVVPLDLHLTKCVFPDLAYLTFPCTDFNIRESLSPYLPVTSLTIVPASVLETLPNLLSPIRAGDSLGYPIVVMSHDPSSYYIPDFYIMPSISTSFPIKDHISPSWMTLLDYPTATGKVSMTLAEAAYRSSFVANDVFIDPPIPVPLNMKTLCPLLFGYPVTPSALQQAQQFPAAVSTSRRPPIADQKVLKP
ncbi:hypothetical protein M5K25_020801 [Dendrobium thyrsiflorum]|uniref:RNA polymerase II subunit B1 CTD phosphatase RPAP2 homolog n=1 Tax=Dendrobium thyrsiflorum TaxID=117978 RepID=A0ABD0UHR8_DENTH